MPQQQRSSSGPWLVALAYLWMMVQPALSLVWMHREVAHKLEPDVSVVSLAFGLVEIMIALGPLRRGERWAFWAALLPLLIIGIPRLVNDSACQLYDLSHHGCHQFMMALTLAGIGLVLSALAIFRKPAASGASS